jgi:hypothetical protein
MPNSFSAVRHYGLVSTRHTEHVHDRQHRQPRRTLGHEVDVAGANEVVDDGDGVQMDLVLDLADISRRERRADQPPIDGVLRRIHRQEERCEPLYLGGHRIKRDALRGGEQLGMLADVRDVSAPRECPIAGFLHREHRREGSVPGEALAPAELCERLIADCEGLTPEVVRRDVDRTVFTCLHRCRCHGFSVTLR